jgi:tripartite-type tricarboxylate transporter receptor subunit TctC
MRRIYHKAMILTGLLMMLLSFGAGTLAAADIPDELKKLKPKDFPQKPIELMVMYPAGGGMDVTARILAKHLEKYVGTKVIVVNKTGGGGMVGHTYLTTVAKPDGYTLGVLCDVIVSNDLLRANGRWSYTDLIPLAFINFTPITWIVRTDSEFGNYSAEQLLAYAKENPGQLDISTMKDIFFDFLNLKIQLTAGVKFNMIPYQGGAAGVTALLGGHLDVANAFLGEFKSHLEAGKVRAVTVSDKQRYVFLPEVPTFNEILGVDDIMFGAYRWITYPKGLDMERAKFLEAAIQMALRDPAVIKDYSNAGIDVGTRYLTGAETAAEVAEIYENYKNLFKAIGRIE